MGKPENAVTSIFLIFLGFFAKRRTPNFDIYTKYAVAVAIDTQDQQTSPLSIFFVDT